MRLPDLITLAASLALLGLAAPAWSQRSSGDNALEPYRLITERSMFDPNRKKAQPASERRPAPAPPAPRTEQLRLVGAMVDEGLEVAFFDGSKSEYQKARSVGDTIAGFRVAGVRTDRVALERDGKAFVIPVGGEISRRGSGAWEIAQFSEPSEQEGDGAPTSSGGGSSPASSSAAASSTSSPSSKSGSAPPSGAAGAVDRAELIRRLMERRQQETKR